MCGSAVSLVHAGDGHHCVHKGSNRGGGKCPPGIKLGGIAPLPCPLNDHQSCPSYLLAILRTDLRISSAASDFV